MILAGLLSGIKGELIKQGVDFSEDNIGTYQDLIKALEKLRLHVVATKKNELVETLEGMIKDVYTSGEEAGKLVPLLRIRQELVNNEIEIAGYQLNAFERSEDGLVYNIGSERLVGLLKKVRSTVSDEHKDLLDQLISGVNLFEEQHNEVVNSSLSQFNQAEDVTITGDTLDGYNC